MYIFVATLYSKFAAAITTSIPYIIVYICIYIYNTQSSVTSHPTLLSICTLLHLLSPFLPAGNARLVPAHAIVREQVRRLPDVRNDALEREALDPRGSRGGRVQRGTGKGAQVGDEPGHGRRRHGRAGLDGGGALLGRQRQDVVAGAPDVDEGARVAVHGARARVVRRPHRQRVRRRRRRLRRRVPVVVARRHDRQEARLEGRFDGVVDDLACGPA